MVARRDEVGVRCRFGEGGMDPRLRSWATRTATAEAAQTHLYKHRGEYKARTRSMKTVRSGKGTAHEQRKTPCEGRVTPCSTPPMELPSLISPGIAPGPALLTSVGALTAKIPRTAAAASTPNRHYDANGKTAKIVTLRGPQLCYMVDSPAMAQRVDMNTPRVTVHDPWP